MKIVTFTIPKGGVGKTLLQANVAAALAMSGKKVIILDADPTKAMETILSAQTGSVTLSQVIKNNGNVKDAVYKTEIENLFLLPSGLNLEAYFDLGPIKLAKKLYELNCDILFIDTAFPLSESAFLALGICQYLILILSEDEFSLCVESGIDLVRMAKFIFNCKPAGFIVNKLRSEKITDKLIDLVERAFEAPCITKIREYDDVKESYGGPKKKEAFVYYKRYPTNEFSKKIDIVAKFIRDLEEVDKKPIETLERMLKQVRV